MPKISIITVLLNALSNPNGKENLLQMFKSIHNQDYEDIEHIIIDGLSNDGTLEYVESITKEFAKKPVLIYSQKDTGIYNAMNKGINKAQGKYIAFMNADDYYLENDAITTLYQAIIDNQASYSCSETLVETVDHKAFIFDADIYKIGYRMPFCHQSMLCKKELFLKYGMFDESLKIVADFSFICKLVFNNELGIEVKKQLVLFRWTGISYQKQDQANQEFAKVIHNYYNKIFTVSDCLAIFSNKVNFILFLKMRFFKLIDKKNLISKKLDNKIKILFVNRVIKDYLNSLKYWVKLRFIAKPIEEFFKNKKLKRV